MSGRFLRALSCPARIIAAVSPLVPLIAGLIGLAAGVFVLRSYGSNFRVGRLLASTPAVSVAEAIALAAGRPRYVAVQGRIDSETDFEDAAHRPLVLRRTRLQVRERGAWTDVEDHRERVPFEIRDGLDSIAVDDSALDEGLVVIARESSGTAADLAERLPAGTRLDLPARLQDRAGLVGRARHRRRRAEARPAGAPTISAGLGRPLILTTLERAEAMRILAHGESRRPMVAFASLVGGLALLGVGMAWAVIGAIW